MAAAAETGATLPGKEGAAKARMPICSAAVKSTFPGAKSTTREVGGRSSNSRRPITGAGTVLISSWQFGRAFSREERGMEVAPSASAQARSLKLRAATVSLQPAPANIFRQHRETRPYPVRRTSNPAMATGNSSIASCSAPSAVRTAFLLPILLCSGSLSLPTRVRNRLW